MADSSKHILVIGGSCIDTKGRADSQIEAGVSTSGSIRVSVGGAARSIAENLARLGEKVILLSAVGNDGSGRSILSQAAECGIDISHVPAIESEIVDLTGTGDALTAAVIFGLLNDLPIGEAVKLGTLAAALTLHCRETVCPTLTLERLYDRL